MLFSDKGENTIRLTDFKTLTPDSSIPKYLSFKYHYLFIDIPIKANYFLINNKTKFFLSGGISMNIFITQKHKAILEFDDGKIVEKTYVMQNGFSRINFAFTAGFGFGYDINDKLYIKLEPQYRRSINSTITNTGLKNHLYSFGVNTGLYWRL